ncbi:MAG: hypothetical protein HQL62_04750 [Magnetococcales bacterium]|nr:hypothetical protein [Magnetococcales bacterium]
MSRLFEKHLLDYCPNANFNGSDLEWFLGGRGGRQVLRDTFRVIQGKSALVLRDLPVTARRHHGPEPGWVRGEARIKSFVPKDLLERVPSGCRAESFLKSTEW